MALIAPTVEAIGDAALTNSIIDRSITELQDSAIEEIYTYAFVGCQSLKKVVFESVTNVQTYAFENCAALTMADFHQPVTLNNYAFSKCSALAALILRGDTLSVRKTLSALTNTPIASGTGYIYVPAVLVDSYKSSTDWSTYANQIRAIEDYPEVCSTLGKVWASCGIKNATPSRIFYGGGKWLATDGGYYSLYTSSDAKTWKQNTRFVNQAVHMPAYANGVWAVGVASSGIRYTTNVEGAWTNSNVTSGTFESIFHKNGMWFAAGNSSSGLYYSEDGKTWTQSNITSVSAKSVDYGNGLWVAGCGDGIYYSEDGRVWTKSNLSTGGFVSYCGNMWITGGGGIYYSEDGKTWTQSNITKSSYFACAYGDGVWVTGTYGGSVSGLYFSTNGKTWSQSNVENVAVANAVYVNGVWLASGKSSGMYFSVDGKTWDTTLTAACELVQSNGEIAVAAAPGIYYSE